MVASLGVAHRGWTRSAARAIRCAAYPHAQNYGRRPRRRCLTFAHEAHRAWQEVSMYVAQICNRNVATVRSSDEVTTAAQLMRERHVGYLVVIEPDAIGAAPVPVGVLTDRDIVVGVVARRVDPAALTVGDIMTAKPVTVAEYDSLEKAAQEMRRIGVRRMPVTGKLGELRGVLSLDDMLDAASGELRDLALAVRNERRIESTQRT
jgi:CBS domain-containing protein